MQREPLAAYDSHRLCQGDADTDSSCEDTDWTSDYEQTSTGTDTNIDTIEWRVISLPLLFWGFLRYTYMLMSLHCTAQHTHAGSVSGEGMSDSQQRKKTLGGEVRRRRGEWLFWDDDMCTV